VALKFFKAGIVVCDGTAADTNWHAISKLSF
jgi:hypothetical protein